MTQSSKKSPADLSETTRHEQKEGQRPASEASHGEPTRVTDKRFWAKKESKPDVAENESTQGGPEVLEAEATQPDHTEPLRNRIHELEEKLGATLAQYKDALDGFEAAKVRIQREVHLEVAKGRKKVLVPLLEVLDNLDRALESEGSDGQQKALFKGVDMVREQFLQRLSDQGIRRVDALGRPFDPTHFEAIATMPVDSAEKDGTVTGVVRQAYVMDQETVRHGMVAVGKFAG